MEQLANLLEYISKKQFFQKGLLNKMGGTENMRVVAGRLVDDVIQLDFARSANFCFRNAFKLLKSFFFIF